MNSSTQTLNNVNLAIASDSMQQRSRLRKMAEQSGMSVVLMEPLTRLFLRKLEKSNAAVLLLDLHDNDNHDEQLVDELLDNVTIPIIFNDVTALTLNDQPLSEHWYQSLLRKIAESTGNENVDVTSFSAIDQRQVMAKAYEKPSSNANTIAKTVWVLGASLGGPDALKRFLAALPADVPASFIVAQHLGANFVKLLAAQLDRSSKLEVMAAHDGHVIHHRQVIVAPVNERIRINPIGNLELSPVTEQSNYMPSIDRVIMDMADRYGKNCGAIIFTGMGDDGIHGCQHLIQQGGRVWVQSAETCVISSMPDNVRRHCDVQVVGSPEYLAKRFIGQFMARKAEML